MKDRTKSLLDIAVMAIVLGFYLVYHYGFSRTDQNTPDSPLVAPSSLDADAALRSHGNKSATVRKNESPLTFGEYPCGDDCSQHEAGYRWAWVHGITEPDNCDGNTGRFIEGCRVYAEERRTELRSKS
jgi:hypothetical protein